MIRKHFKCILVTILLNFILVNAGSSQTAILLLLFGDDLATEDLHLSVDAAFNLSDISNLQNKGMQLGANFGLGLHMKINDRWQFNPQFRPLSQKGVRNTNPLVDLPNELDPLQTNIRLNYFDVPIMVRYNITSRFFIATGPQISFLSSAYQTTDGSYSNNLDGYLRINVKEYFQKVNFGFPVEIGYWLHFTNKKTSSVLKMNIFLRYCPDFIETFKDTQKYGNSKLSTFQIGVSFPTIKN